MFEYHMVQIPPNVSVKSGKSGGAAAAYLADVVGNYAGQGWEFYSIEAIGITEHPGCGCLSFILSLFGGNQTTHTEVYVIVFRRTRTVQEQMAPPPPGTRP